eukprot:365001-Chlamydomonas_euryale.AAC.3
MPHAIPNGKPPSCSRPTAAALRLTDDLRLFGQWASACVGNWRSSSGGRHVLAPPLPRSWTVCEGHMQCQFVPSLSRDDRRHLGRLSGRLTLTCPLF